MSPKLDRHAIAAVAQELALSGEHDKAIEAYTKIVEENPRDVQIWIRIGDLHAKKGAAADARNVYLKSAERCSEQGFYLKALALYQRALTLGGGEVDIHARMAELCKQLGQLRDAILHYELVADRYQREGLMTAALAAVREILDLDPLHEASRVKLVELATRQRVAQEGSGSAAAPAALVGRSDAESASASSPPAPAGTRYYLRRTGKVYGPFLERAIVAMLRTHKLDGDEEIALDGESWRPLASVPVFAAYIPAGGGHAPAGAPGSGIDTRAPRSPVARQRPAEAASRAQQCADARAGTVGGMEEAGGRETATDASRGVVVPARFKISPVRCDRLTEAELNARTQRRVLAALVERGLISSEQRARVEGCVETTPASVASELVRQGIVAEVLLDVLSRGYGVPSVDLDAFDLDPEVVSLVPRAVAVAGSLVAVSRAGSALIIAMAAPWDVFAIDTVRFITEYWIEVVVASPRAIEDAIRRYYPAVN